MLTHRLNKEYKMYDKILKCPRPSVTCKKGALSACDFLPEKNTSSICHGKLQEIVKAETRRFFRSTFQSRPGIIYPPITYHYLCFDLVVKSLFLAMINMVYCEYSLPLQMERTTRYNTKIQIFPHPFLKEGTNPKGIPFWRNKRSEKGTSEHILSQFRTALLSPSLV